MLYELHLTTDPDVCLADWIGWTNRAGQKALDIRLAAQDATNPRQIMTAGTYEGIDATAAEWVYNLQEEMLAAGFPIQRAKLEVPLDKSGPYIGRISYYEAHVKSLVPENRYPFLVKETHSLGWVVSYNALFEHQDGLRKVYLTKRRSGNDHYIDAGHKLSLAFSKLAPSSFHTVRMESEAVIDDTNPMIDEGWADVPV
jgi:hypothetical protein